MYSAELAQCSVWSALFGVKGTSFCAMRQIFSGKMWGSPSPTLPEMGRGCQDWGVTLLSDYDLFAVDDIESFGWGGGGASLEVVATSGGGEGGGG